MINTLKQAKNALEYPYKEGNSVADAIESLKQLIQDIEKNEPVAWMHKQGNYKEPSLRQLDDWEIEHKWEQYPLYTHPLKQKRNFCERCGKRLFDGIHTCTPPGE